MWSKYDEQGKFAPLYKAEEGHLDLDHIDPSSQQGETKEKNNVE